MSILESFGDSRAGGGDGGGLPAPAAPVPVAANAGVEVVAAREGLNGHDVVFPIVLALYCFQRERIQQQQRRQREREWSLGRRRRKSSVSGEGGTDDDTTDGDGDGVGCCSSRSGKGEASAVCAATVVDPTGMASGTACGHDSEGETEALVRELQEARSVHPREVEFYLPQLCMIVGLGDFTRPPALVEFLLELCQSDLRLAHKIHWFLKSYCSEGGSPQSLVGLSSFALRVQKRGCAVASRLSRALARQAVNDHGVGRPQRRDVVNRDSKRDGEGADGVTGEMEAECVGERKPGCVPSVWRGASEKERGDGEQEEEEEDDSLAEHYDPAMFFIEALLGLAEQLGALSPKKRAKGLQEGLEGINEFFLSQRAQGSDVIYVPFGEDFHQIRAIHPRESMHFSTKERVPLLVCLEVQHVRVPTATARSTAKAGRMKIPTTIPDGGRGAEAVLIVEGEGDAKGERPETEEGGGHAGEAGLMERFRGTVRSFVKLRSNESKEDVASEEKKNHQGHESLASPLGRHDPGDTIEADECSSRTASEPDLGDSNESHRSSNSNPILRHPRGAVATAAASGNFQERSNPNDDSEMKGRCDENDGDEEDELEYDYDNGGDCGGFGRFGYDNEGENHGGASSQGGFWYGEGGGASALEAALGQWGGYLDVTAAVTAEADLAVTSAADAGGVDPEDESWEIVDAPVHWEGDSKPAATTAAGEGDTGSGSGCGSDSYSEYLAAAEAEQRDCQLEAEAEEAEQATLKAEVEAEVGGVPPLTKEAIGRRESGVKTSACPGVAVGGLKPTGRSYFAPVAGAATAAVKGAVMSAGAAGGVVGRERRRRRRGASEPRIIFKERWREKELRVWQEARCYDSSAVTAEMEAFCNGDGGGEGRGGDDELCTVERERGGSLPLKGWSLLPIIVKANDDLRQEQFVSNLVAVFDQIFRKAQLGARLRPYEIMATSPTAGVIEAIPDTVSLDALKRHTHHLALHEFFRRYFGRKGMLREARANFVESCAAYSVVCYLLQIKDRHNGNILLSADGHLIHIDWGFALDLSPGGNLGFESAPFKLTQEFVEVMGGARSNSFQKYRRLCVRAFLEARRSRDKIITLVEMMMAFRPDLACFGGRPEVVLKHLRARFQPDRNPESCVTFVHELIQQSVDNWRTRLYDTYQRAVVGIQ